MGYHGDDNDDEYELVERQNTQEEKQVVYKYLEKSNNIYDSWPLGYLERIMYFISKNLRNEVQRVFNGTYLPENMLLRDILTKYFAQTEMFEKMVDKLLEKSLDEWHKDYNSSRALELTDERYFERLELQGLTPAQRKVVFDFFKKQKNQ